MHIRRPTVTPARPPLRRGLTAALVLASCVLFVLPSDAADQQPIQRAEALLKSKDVQDRLHALEILAEAPEGKKLEKAVSRALEDEDWGVQIDAARLTATRRLDGLADTLADLAVEGEIEWVRTAAAESLGELDPVSAADMILDRGKRSREDGRLERAVRSAGLVARADDDARISGFAKNKDVYVAATAAAALGRAAADPGRREHVLASLGPVLSKRNDKKHFLAYSAAVAALAAVDDDTLRELAVREVARQELDDGYLLERVGRGLSAAGAEKGGAAIAAVLAETESALALRRLARLAGRSLAGGARPQLEELAAHDHERVRSEAVRALGLIGDDAALPTVRERLGDGSRFVQIEAVTALRALLPTAEFFALGETLREESDEKVRLQWVVEMFDADDPAGIEALTPYLRDRSWRVSSAAAATVGALGISDDMPLLTPLLGNRDWRVRAAAFEGLGRLRAVSAIPHLITGLKDRDPTVKGVCLTNLRVLTRLKWDYKGKWTEWFAKNGSHLDIEKHSRKPRREEKPEQDAEDDPNSRYGPAHRGRITRDQGVEILQKARILVIKGAWDKVEVVLGHLDIPHTPMRAQQLKTAGLGPNQILLVNCEGNVDSDTAMRIDWFTNVGGYLMTTDWALTKTVMPIYPGYVTQYARSSTGNDVVTVQEGTPGHPYTAGIFDGVPSLQWWLEIRAFPITVLYPERVTTLVDSAQMRQRYGSSPMGIEFRSGLGRVQHSLSHFFLQEEGLQHASKPRDRMVFAADNLGLSLKTIRELAAEGAFDGRLSEETLKQIAPEYSMFRMIVNFVAEKSRWVEEL